MGLYDAFKEVLSVAQKADNVDLYKQLLDLSAQALELQAENARLKEELSNLNKKKDIESRIIRHQESYLSFQDDDLNLCYCTKCWDVDEKLVQLQCDPETGGFSCPQCHMSGTYDENAKQRYIQGVRDNASSLNSMYDAYGLYN